MQSRPRRRTCGISLHALQLRLPQPPQNQLQLAECSRLKICTVGCEVRSGVASKSLLKVRLRCKACHALRGQAASAKSIAPCRMHLQKKLHGVLRCAKWGWCTKSLLKVRLRCKAGHAEERAAFYSIPLHASNSATPLLQHRKINCTLQNALVEKAAWWAAMCYAAFHSAPRHQPRIRSSAKSSKLQRPKICMVGCDVLSGVGT